MMTMRHSSAVYDSIHIYSAHARTHFSVTVILQVRRCQSQWKNPFEVYNASRHICIHKSKTRVLVVIALKFNFIYLKLSFFSLEDCKNPIRLKDGRNK